MPDVTYTVFFSGTDHKKKRQSTLLNLLKNHVVSNENQHSLAFDGCGVTHGSRGGLFGHGLDEQCEEVISSVLAEIQKGSKVILNVYGLSRGAVAALMLARQLGEIDPELLEINLALLDPVPGNLITPSIFDPFETTLANKAKDLSQSRNLSRVLALYPHIPLPTLAFHAPLIAQYPAETTIVEEDAIAGCHAGAQDITTTGDRVTFSRASLICFARIYRFLKERGTEFSPLPRLFVDDPYFEVNIDNLDEALLRVYTAENQQLPGESFDRASHSQKSMLIKTKEKADYFNIHHQFLAGEIEDVDKARVTIEKDRGILATLSRATLEYPKIWNALKWGTLGLGLACLIIFTSGFGLIPVTASLLTPSVLLVSTLILTPIAALLLSGVWHGLVQPVLAWIVNAIAYPQFEMREVPGYEHPIDESSDFMLARFGGRGSDRDQAQQTTNQPRKLPTRLKFFDLVASNANQDDLDTGPGLW